MYGYARASTSEQNLDSQVDALLEAGCSHVISEVGSGASRNRPELSQLLQALRPGDVLVAWKLDRVARSLQHLLEVISTIQKTGAHFRCLTAPIDTNSPTGTLILQILGAIAEFERGLIRERTLAGLQSAANRGRTGGNPKLKSGDKNHVKLLVDLRRKTFQEKVRRNAKLWLPIIRKSRPQKSWNRCLTQVNAKCPRNSQFTLPKLLRHVKVGIELGWLEGSVLEQAPPLISAPLLLEESPAIKVIVVALRARANSTLRELAAELKAARIRSPQGLNEWPLSSVSNLVKRARMLRFSLNS